MSQTQKWVNLGLLLATVVVFYVLMQIMSMVWDWFRLPLLDDWLVSPDVLASLILASGAGLMLRRHAKVNQYLNDVAIELMKVTWPNQKETVASTGVVIVMTILAALILLVFDTIWGTVTQGFLT